MTTDPYRAQLLDARSQAGHDPAESAQLLDALTASLHPALYLAVLPALGFTGDQAAFGYGVNTAARLMSQVTTALPYPAGLEDAGAGAFFVTIELPSGPADIGYIDPTDPHGHWGSLTNAEGDPPAVEDGPHGLFSDPQTVAAWLIHEAERNGLSIS